MEYMMMITMQYQIAGRAQRVPAEEVGVAEAKDAVSEGELKAEVDDKTVKLPQCNRLFSVPAAYQL